ncbi:hypothetical protein [Acinetobacter portensis]|uniref:hypothetical protein n=1 Tax=Acinetobacter portensis TaxID=1839785 RepID=UPI0013D67D41|nr:hypothetical protein [Acinetobacter portensis]
MSISTELNISDLTAIIIALVALFIAFKKNIYDKNRAKYTLRAQIIDRCNMLIQHEITIAELTNSIINAEKKDKILKINKGGINNILDIYQTILDLPLSIELKDYDEHLEALQDLEITSLKRIKLLTDHFSQ